MPTKRFSHDNLKLVKKIAFLPPGLDNRALKIISQSAKLPLGKWSVALLYAPTQGHYSPVAQW